MPLASSINLGRPIGFLGRPGRLFFSLDAMLEAYYDPGLKGTSTEPLNREHQEGHSRDRLSMVETDEIPAQISMARVSCTRGGTGLHHPFRL